MYGSGTDAEIERLKRDLNGAQANLNSVFNKVEQTAGLGNGYNSTPIQYSPSGSNNQGPQVIYSSPTQYPQSYQSVNTPNYSSTQYISGGEDTGRRLSPAPIRITSNTIPSTITPSSAGYPYPSSGTLSSPIVTQHQSGKICLTQRCRRRQCLVDWWFSAKEPLPLHTEISIHMASQSTPLLRGL